jgi:hypothetical protein
MTMANAREAARPIAPGDSLRVRMQSVERAKVWRVYLNDRFVGLVRRLPSGLFEGAARCQGVIRSAGSSPTRQQSALATACTYVAIEHSVRAVDRGGTS